MRKKALLQLGPCPQCGTHFESRYPKLFCTLRCYLDSPMFKERMRALNKKQKEMRVRGECLECGGEFFAKASRKKRFCSQNHYRAYLAKRFDRWIASPEGIALPQAYDEFMTLSELPCLVDGCDWQGQHLGAHVNFAHGITADEFKKMAGFNRGTGLCTAEVSQKLSERPHLSLAMFPPNFVRSKTDNRGAQHVSHEALEHLIKGRALAAATLQPPARVCKGCGKSFEQSTVYGAALFCTTKCRSKFYREAMPVFTLICGHCGVAFQSRAPNQKKRNDEGLPVFCGYKCRGLHNSHKKRKPKGIAFDALEAAQ